MWLGDERGGVSGVLWSTKTTSAMSSVGRQGHDVGKNADSGSTLDRFFFGWRWRRPTMEEDKRPQGVPDDGLVAIEKRTEVEKAVEVDLERGNNRGKKIIGLVIACIVIAVIVDLLTHNNVKSWLEEALEWIERNPWSGELQSAEYRSTLIAGSVEFCFLKLILKWP